MAPKSILKTAQRFIEIIRRQGIPVRNAYLFGSWVQGRADESSDIDLAVVSEKFQGIKFYDRRKLDDAVLSVDTDIHVHPYRPEDFTEDNPFVREILRTGVRIV